MNIPPFSFSTLARTHAAHNDLQRLIGEKIFAVTSATTDDSQLLIFELKSGRSIFMGANRFYSSKTYRTIQGGELLAVINKPIVKISARIVVDNPNRSIVTNFNFATKKKSVSIRWHFQYEGKIKNCFVNSVFCGIVT